MKASHYTLAFLTVCLLLATAVLRFQALDGMLIWHDEVYTISRVFGIQHQELVEAVHDGKVHTPGELLRLQNRQPDRGFGNTLRSLMEHPEHGPLYFLLGWAVADWTDEPILSLRGLSAVFSLLFIPAVYWFARELGGRRYAWLAMVLFAASPLFFLYAREARPYALWLVLVAAASAALLRLLRNPGVKSYMVYIGLLALALYTQLMTGLLILAHALFLILRFHGQRGELLRLGRGLLLAWGCVLLLFVPWLTVMYEQAENFQRFTGWMSQSASIAKLVSAWLGHLLHLFVDLPGADVFRIMGGILVLVLSIPYFRQAERQSRLLVGALIATGSFFVVLPDLLLGGRRSLETRYLLPLLLAVELMVVWTLDRGLSSNGSSVRKLSLAALVFLAGAGLASQYRIASADSWWTKSFSAENAAFTRLVNASEKPLILGSYHAVSTGEILSLAHLLDPQVRVLMQGQESEVEIPAGYTRLFAFMPSDQLRAQLEQHYRLEPFSGSWKWFVVSPRE